MKYKYEMLTARNDEFLWDLNAKVSLNESYN